MLAEIFTIRIGKLGDFSHTVSKTLDLLGFLGILLPPDQLLNGLVSRV